MGLLEDLKNIENKLHFYIYDGEHKYLTAWVDQNNGSMRIDPARIETKEESKALCQWYLSVCDEL
jgi:hypothetical protein